MDEIAEEEHWRCTVAQGMDVLGYWPRTEEECHLNSQLEDRGVQLEKIHANGRRDVDFGDGARLSLHPDGRSERKFSNGTVIIDVGEKRLATQDSWVQSAPWPTSESELAAVPAMPTGLDAVHLERHLANGTKLIRHSDGVTEERFSNADVKYTSASGVQHWESSHPLKTRPSKFDALAILDLSCVADWLRDSSFKSRAPHKRDGQIDRMCRPMVHAI